LGKGLARESAKPCAAKFVSGGFPAPQNNFADELKLVEGKLKIALLARSESETVLNN